MFKRVTKTNVYKIRELAALQSIEVQRKLSYSERVLKLIRAI